MATSNRVLKLGEMVNWDGDITENHWVGARSARDLERNLGFGQGRLSAGWWLLVLKQKLVPEDFIFGGLTLRSGGRYGKPAKTRQEDKARPHVHDTMLLEYGSAEVERRQRQSLAQVSYSGPRRLVKIVPNTRDDPDAPPSLQYPMGGGGLQWKLTRECRFMVAVRVDAHGNAMTPQFSVFLGESATYADRHKLARYIETA